jgi:hypothetical protein
MSEGTKGWRRVAGSARDISYKCPTTAKRSDANETSTTRVVEGTKVLRQVADSVGDSLRVPACTWKYRGASDNCLTTAKGSDVSYTYVRGY